MKKNLLIFQTLRQSNNIYLPKLLNNNAAAYRFNTLAA